MANGIFAGELTNFSVLARISHTLLRQLAREERLQRGAGDILRDIMLSLKAPGKCRSFPKCTPREEPERKREQLTRKRRASIKLFYITLRSPTRARARALAFALPRSHNINARYISRVRRHPRVFFVHTHISIRRGVAKSPKYREKHFALAYSDVYSPAYRIYDSKSFFSPPLSIILPSSSSYPRRITCFSRSNASAKSSRTLSRTRTCEIKRKILIRRTKGEGTKFVADS